MSDQNKEEESYFKQRELERHEALRRERELKALRQEEREGIVQTLSTTEDIANEALELGFDAQTARVLPLVPMIEVAWADGTVSTDEESTVLDLAIRRGIERGTASYEFLQRLMTERPSSLFFERVNRVIMAMVASDPESWMTETLPELAIKVAEASGGFFGLGDKVAAEERELIEKLAEQLNVAQKNPDLAVFKPADE
ncbi:MAG: hypothetical protein AAGI01_06145 [Myxococcota bacterium]